jgi:ATP-binding cassette, subfamily B, multidrug efflux pump
MAEEKKRKRIFDFSLLRRVFHYAAPYKGRLYWSVVLAILLAIISPLRPWLIQLTINDFIRRGSAPGLPIKEMMEIAIIWITVKQIGLLLLETVLLPRGWARR